MENYWILNILQTKFDTRGLIDTMPLLAWIPGIHCISIGFGLQQTPSRTAKNNKNPSKRSNLLLIPVTIPNKAAIYDLTLKTCFIMKAVWGASVTSESRKKVWETWLISRRMSHIATQVCTGLDMWYGLMLSSLHSWRSVMLLWCVDSENFLDTLMFRQL